MTCPDCQEAAKHWAWGGFHANCRGCITRMIAISPKHIRDAEYRLCATDAEREQIKGAVQLEYARIQALRRETEDR